MDMPCNCPECGEVVELNDMQESPVEDDKRMVCGECYEKIEREDNSGSQVDYFGNDIGWVFDSDNWTITFYLGDKEITCWSIESDKDCAVEDFMKVWNLAQQSSPQR